MGSSDGLRTTVQKVWAGALSGVARCDEENQVWINRPKEAIVRAGYRYRSHSPPKPETVSDRFPVTTEYGDALQIQETWDEVSHY